MWKKCKFCKEQFFARRKDIVYCSKECSYEVEKKKARERWHKKYKNNEKIKTVEQCNNCDIVERENKILRKMVLDLQQKNTLLLENQESVVQSIAKAANIKITGRKFTLPGKRNTILRREKTGQRNCFLRLARLWILLTRKQRLNFRGYWINNEKRK